MRMSVGAKHCADPQVRDHDDRYRDGTAEGGEIQERGKFGRSEP